MATTRHFSYNIGATVTGTEKLGNLTIGTPTVGFSSSGVTGWRRGPDEDLGYIIAYPSTVPRTAGAGSESLSGTNIGYQRSDAKTDSSFLLLANSIGATSFSTALDAKIWLNTNNYWTSWIDNPANAFYTRVIGNAGYKLEATSCLDTLMSTLVSSGVNATSTLIVTPNAYNAGKIYSVVPNTIAGDQTFIRATPGTRINSSGVMETVASGYPRLDYTNSSCPVLLIEPVSTNLLQYSNTLTNAYWQKTNTTVTQSATVNFLDNVKTYQVVETATNAIHTIHELDLGIPKLASTPYTLSCFFKKGTGASAPNIIRLVLNLSQGEWANFNISTGTLLSRSGTAITSSIQAYPNGWYRCSVTGTDTFTILRTAFQFINNTDSNLGVTSVTYAGSTNSDIFASGMQLELGSVMTAYIPTPSTSAVTRNADIVSIVPPVGTLKITTNFESSSTILTTIPGSFTIPNGRISNIIMQNVI